MGTVPGGNDIAISQRYSDQEIADKWETFFQDYNYIFTINEVAQSYPDKRSVYVEFPDIDRFDPDFGDFILNHPNQAIEQGRRAMESAAQVTERFDVNLRIRNLPEEAVIKIRDLRAAHMGKFLSIRGLIKKTVEVRPRVLRAVFQCERCKEVNVVEQDDPSKLKEPFKCQGCERTLSSTSFKVLVDHSTFVDSQKIELEELPEELEGGARAERLTIILEDDMTGEVNPGETVVVNGVLMSQPQRNRQGAKSPMFDIFLVSNSVDRMETDFGEIDISPEEEMEILRTSKEASLWDNMVRSISPSIKGLETIKEALVLQLFGGVVKVQPDGQRIRGDIHLMLLGDPGTAKSQLLRYMARLAPRGRYTQGKASSAAGLTAAAVRDEFGDGRWTLEAGALVLADKGLACIDELDKMEPGDRSSLHEAMEQQTVTITKAGINATLQARCSMLAAANPKDGRFSNDSPYLQQISSKISPALLTRFDIIFSIADEPDLATDTDVSEHILKSHVLGEALAREKMGDSTKEIRSTIDENMPDLSVPYDVEFMRKYVAYAKKNIIPLMTEETRKKIQDFYLELRVPEVDDTKKQGHKSVAITARKLEALVRLAEASAKVRLSKTVELQDAERSIRIVREFLEKNVRGEGGQLDIDMLETGLSTSQRSQIATIRKIMLENDDTRGIPMDDLIELATGRGIPKENVKSIVNLMRNRGDIIAKKDGYYRLV